MHGPCCPARCWHNERDFHDFLGLSVRESGVWAVMTWQDVEQGWFLAAQKRKGSAKARGIARFFSAVVGVASSVLVFAPRASLAAEQPKPAADSAVKADAGHASDIAKGLAELQRKKKRGVTFSSAFKTRFFAARTQKTRESKGSVMYLPPQKFKWEVTAPESEVYVSSGQVLWKYSPAAKHATRMASQEAGLEFLQALTDPQALQQRYAFSQWEGASGNDSAKSAKSATDFDALPTSATKPPPGQGKLLAKLTPKLEGTPEEYLYLVADRTNGQVDEIRIAFRNGNRNVITFGSWSEVNAVPAVFDFSPPPGTAVDKM